MLNITPINAGGGIYVPLSWAVVRTKADRERIAMVCLARVR